MNSRRVLITGCSSGIGRASAELLAARGHEVIATARRPETLTDLKVARTLRLDVTDPASVERARDEAGEIDILINNAGRGLRSPVELADPALLRELWEVNVLGPTMMIRAFLPGMRARGHGRVINITSVAGRRSMPLTGHYAATKYAVEAVSEALRWEVRQFGIDVVIVEPGAVSTEFSRNRLGIDGDLGPYNDLAARATRWSRSVNEPAQSAEEVAEVVAEAVEAERVPLRLPTSPGVARMIADRQGRNDEEFENWVIAGLGDGGRGVTAPAERIGRPAVDPREAHERGKDSGPPLRGVRVVELAGKGPSQLGAMVLADLGADVVRVDRRSAVDRPLASYDPRLDLLNRGRRSLALDLRQEDGVRLFLKLVATADAVIDPFRPGVTDRLGIGASACHEVRPDLVYVRMTGWGSDGPYAGVAGHDINFLAANGILDLIGRSGERPVPPLNLVGDFGGGGMMLAVAVLAGVMASRSGAGGQVVDVSMLDASALLGTVVHALRAMDSWGPRGTNLLDTGAPYYEVYETADGRFLSVGAMERVFYLRFLDLLGLGADELLVAAHQDRSLWPAAKERIAAVIRARTREEWAQAFAGRDACVEPVRSLDEAMEHPQVVHRALYRRIFGVVQPAAAPRFERTAATVDRPPPVPGEHSDELLRELKIADEEIEELRDRQVIT